MIDRVLSVAVTAAVLAACSIGAVSVWTTDPLWGAFHISTIAAGFGLFLMLRSMKWNTIVSFGPPLFAMSVLAALSCLHDAPVHGRHTISTLFGWKFCPGYFIPPAYALTLAYGHAKQRGYLFVIGCTGAAVGALTACIQLQTALTVLLTLAMVHHLYNGENARCRLNSCTVALSVAFLALLPIIMSKRNFVESASLTRDINILAVRTALSYIPFPFHNDFFDGAVIQAGWKLGAWAPLTLACLWGLLVLALFMAALRTKEPSARICALAGTVILTLPPLLNVTHFIAGFPRSKESVNFLSCGTSLMLASFLTLGIFAKAAWSAPDRAPAGLLRLLALRVAGATLFCTGLCSIAFSQRPPLPKFYEERIHPPERGAILAADGTTLARSVPCWEFRLDPQSDAGDRKTWTDEKVATALAEALELDRSVITSALARTDNRYIRLKTTTDPEYRKAIGRNTRNWKLAVARFEAREYPLGPATAQVLGVAKCMSYERPAGLFGLEALHNATLVKGMTLKTEIIPKVQLYMYRLLSGIVATNNAECAWAVVVAGDGEHVYAMTGYPSFEPGDYGTADALHRRNHPAVYAYAPGDIVSPLVPEAITNSAKLVFKRLSHLGFGDSGRDFAGESPGSLPDPLLRVTEAFDGGDVLGGLKATSLQLAVAFKRAADENMPVLRRHSSARLPDESSRSIHTVTANVRGRVFVITVKAPADDAKCRNCLLSLPLEELEF